VLGTSRLNAGLLGAGETPRAPGMKIPALRPRAEVHVIVKGGDLSRILRLRKRQATGAPRLCSSTARKSFSRQALPRLRRQGDPSAMRSGFFPACAAWTGRI
jgi:hypothetical protein